MFWPWECARVDIIGKGPRCLGQNATHIGVLLDEARKAPCTQASHILPDQHLCVALVACADPHRWDGHGLCDSGSDLTRYHLDQKRERSGRLECLGSFDQMLCTVIAPLDAVAAKL